MLTRWALSGRSRPVIALDWSPVESGYRFQMLKAVVALDGRGLTLYEEVHRVAGVSRGRAERTMLKRLAAMVPTQCCPIIVSDAGFHGAWFRAVRELGWDFVGRVRGTVHVRLGSDNDWRRISDMHALATSSPISFTRAEVSREHRYPARLCINRAYKPRRGRRRNDRPVNHKGREPWVLVTSLDEQQASTAQIMNVYARRMQIEQTFRDMKAPRWGFAIGYARSRTTSRCEVLLLLAALALFALWLVGLAARALKWHRHFQANTVSNRHVLSIITLGREVHRHPRFRLTDELMDATAELLRLNVQDLRACS